MIDIVLEFGNDDAMATVTTTPRTLHVSPTRAERVLGLLRDLEVPLSAVRSVDVVPDGPAAARGVRAPGLGLPGLRLIGTWRGRGGKSLVSVRRGQPAVRVRLTGQRFDTLLLGVDDPAAVAGALPPAR
ncbi:hypothetical protein SAMN04488546_1612 [Geodermatophilus poikilotrophus]|uniref:Uncharacterized protein n=1 Tax=Geodermatophilus poikilotrophus TaxID=1333667 RepID=A0A1I0CIY5_9ACTN|nr:hypothetical protein SAMN04488546_1612 [Geodermatophilus poikilotrophus]